MHPTKQPYEIFEALLQKCEKMPGFDTDLITRAYNTALQAHQDQSRLSGEPYIIHPLEVACIIADFALDSESIAAGLLHDVVEDTKMTKEDLQKQFGDDIAEMVDGVTKLGKIHFTTQEEEQIENLRKMFIATATDIRVMLIKLADRLHNMRTLEYMSDAKRRQKSRETIEVFAPIAHRLGMFVVKVEMEDLALKYLDPIACAEIENAIERQKSENKDFLDQIIGKLQAKLKEIHVKGQVFGRIKHTYSIFKKTYAQGRNIDDIYDIFGIRVIVNTIPECYAVLGTIHDMYTPLPGRIKDYIAMPKPNLYQSLHTTVIGRDGIPFEVQIRTQEMHRVSEYGVAAHWKYKESTKGGKQDEKFAWIRQMLELEHDVQDNDEFMRAIKIDMFSDEVFVFTPKGDVIALPSGSCPIDFAYSIHSAIGSKMMGAKVNGKLVPLDYILQNGDIVDVLTSGSIHGPSRDWLKIVKTSSARSKINQWFKKERREENIEHGADLFEKEAKKSGYSVSQLLDTEAFASILKKQSFVGVQDLYAAIGYGGITAAKAITRMREECNKNLKKIQKTEPEKRPAQHKTTSSKGIVVEGIDNCLVRLSRCCSPVPGDEIVGYITRGRGVSVHRADCDNVRCNFVGEGQSDRLINVSWEQATQEGTTYNADLLIIADNRTDLLADVTNAISLFKIPTTNFNARISKDGVAHVTLSITIRTHDQLDQLTKKLMLLDGVSKVDRYMG